MTKNYEDIMKKYECTFIDKTIFTIIKSSYAEKIFEFTDFDRKEHHTVHLLSNFNISDKDVLAEITILPILHIHSIKEIDKYEDIYCIINKAGESIESS